MNKILALWAIPRSTSTAFEYMMRMRGDLTCLHEPFGEAWYQGENPLWPRVKENSLRTKGLTLDSVWQKIQQLHQQNPVFIKDFPHYIETIWTDSFLGHFNHSFLIRNPIYTMASWFRGDNDFTIKEAGFVEQRQLFDRLRNESAQIPPIIDSDDLLANPEKTIEKYCQAVNIPFIKEALTWQNGIQENLSWWDGGAFHHNLRNSTGIAAQQLKPIKYENLPDKAKEICDAVMEHYQYLKQFKLSV